MTDVVDPREANYESNWCLLEVVRTGKMSLYDSRVYSKVIAISESNKEGSDIYVFWTSCCLADGSVWRLLLDEALC